MSRDRDQHDRPAVAVTALPDRLPELFGLLAPLGDDLGKKLAELDANTFAVAPEQRAAVRSANTGRASPAT